MQVKAYDDWHAYDDKHERQSGDADVGQRVFLVPIDCSNQYMLRHPSELLMFMVRL